MEGSRTSLVRRTGSSVSMGWAERREVVGEGRWEVEGRGVWMRGGE